MGVQVVVQEKENDENSREAVPALGRPSKSTHTTPAASSEQSGPFPSTRAPKKKKKRRGTKQRPVTIGNQRTNWTTPGLRQEALAECLVLTVQHKRNQKRVLVTALCPKSKVGKTKRKRGSTKFRPGSTVLRKYTKILQVRLI